MTHDTSAHGGSLSRRWADTGQNRTNLDWQIEQRVAGEATPLQLLALSVIAGLVPSLIITMAWQAATDAALHFAVLIAAGTVAALIVLRPRNPPTPAPQEERQTPPEEASRLLAQMHHELRTPLNAMIGFSEVMLRELHGPLGHARYQEYAAHINESGGRLLKASEDALAVAATMSALVADRRALRRERLPAVALLQEAWAASAVPGQDIQLYVGDCAAMEIECDWRTTSQALQHLLCEAVARTPTGGAITARADCYSGARNIEIAVWASRPAPACPTAPADGCYAPNDHAAVGDCLRLILARSLLEMQGVMLSLRTQREAEGWSARIAFPATASGQPQGQKRRPSAGARWPTFPARRGDFAAGAAARASEGSHVAPQA